MYWCLSYLLVGFPNVAESACIRMVSNKLAYVLLCSLNINVFSALSKKGTVQSFPNDLLWLRFITQSMFFEYFLMLCGINSCFSLVSKFLNIFEPFLYCLIKSTRVDELFSVGHSLL